MLQIYSTRSTQIVNLTCATALLQDNELTKSRYYQDAALPAPPSEFYIDEFQNNNPKMVIELDVQAL